MADNRIEEDIATSCRTLAWYLGGLNPSLSNYGKIKSLVEMNLQWRLEQLNAYERKYFYLKDANLVYSEGIRRILNGAVMDCETQFANEQHEKVVLFIHGLGGEPKNTWGKFPNLINEDEELKQNYSTELYKYPTGFFKVPWFGKIYCDIDTLAQGLRTYIDAKLSSYNEIVLVCHSLGGLVARKYILNETIAGRRHKVKRAIYFGTPHRGSALAGIADLISFNHRQLKQLCRNSEFLTELNTNWARLNIDQQIVKKLVIGGQDRIVDQASAQFEDGDDNLAVCPSKDHKGLVKPKDSDDLSFIICKSFLLGVE